MRGGGLARNARDLFLRFFCFFRHRTGIMESVPEFGRDEEFLSLDKTLLYRLCYGAPYLPFITVDPRAINVPDSKLDASIHCLFDLSCSGAERTPW